MSQNSGKYEESKLFAARRNLWQAALTRLLFDCCGISMAPQTDTDVNALRAEARSYFLTPTDDEAESYVLLCELAGADPIAVHDLAVRLIYARKTGHWDYVPEVWRKIHKTGRVPSEAFLFG